jgi:hypothetical protein
LNLFVSSYPATRVPAIAGASVALCFDLVAHHVVFVLSTSSTSALLMLFIPLWSTLIFSPLAIFVVWLFLRRRGVKCPPESGEGNQHE